MTAGTWAANWNVQGSHLPGMAEQQHRSPDVRPHMELTRGPPVCRLWRGRGPVDVADLTVDQGFLSRHSSLHVDIISVLQKETCYRHNMVKNFQS